MLFCNLQLSKLGETDLSNICTDISKFESVFKMPSNSSVSMLEVQETICGFSVNFTKMVQELTTNVDGLSDFLQMVSVIT